jgi:hypothetical protein
LTPAIDMQSRLNFGSGDRPRASKQLEIFAIRALDLADQVAAGQLRFLDAVDMAYEAATWAGLVKAVGDDIVQATLAAAFANARRPV